MLAPLARGRTAVFVDASNIFYSQRTLGWLMDYEKLMRYFRRETQLAFVRFYTGFDAGNEKQQHFIRKLARLGYLVCAKEVKVIKTGGGKVAHKGNLDAELIIDAMKYIDAYDTCVLMSGDSDFAPLLDELKARKKRVIVMSSKDHVARELLERAKYVNLRRLEGELAYKKSPPTLQPGEKSDG